MPEIDEKTLSILDALAPQQNNPTVNNMMMNMLMSALQPKASPEDQLRELFAQSKVNAGDFQGALDALNAKPGDLASLFSQSGGVTSGEQSIIGSQLEALIADTDDPSEQLKLSKLADNPAKAKEFIEFKPESSFMERVRDGSLKDGGTDMGTGERAARIIGSLFLGPGAFTAGDGVDTMDVIFGGKTKQKQKDSFLAQLLK